MRKIYTVLFIIIYCVPYIYSQQQQHIPWPSYADSPWPTTRGDAQATGRSQYVGPRTPNVLWRKDMPLGILHGPVIGYNDDLFFGSRSINSGEINYFYSLDKDGNIRWSYQTEGGRPNLTGATIARDGTIYFSSLGYLNLTGGGLYAVNPDGTLKWRNEKFVFGVYTRFIAVGKDSNLYTPWFNTLYIIDPKNGTILDSSIVADFGNHELVFSAGGDTIYYFSGRIGTEEPKNLIAVTIQGEYLWSYEFYVYSANRGTPVVDNQNRIYVFGAETPANRFLYCINPDGTVNWRHQLETRENFENHSSPTIDKNGNVIFPSSKFTDTGADSGYITSLDYNGNLNWQTSIGHYWNDGAFINSGLVCDAEGKIYCGSTYGTNTNFWCLDSNGTILWKLSLEGYQYDTSPAINSEGTLYIGTHLSISYPFHERNLIALSDEGMSVEEEGTEMTFRLYQNYPNPFNPETHIDFMLMERTKVTLKVYNTLGQVIKILVNEEMIPGYYSRLFEGKELPSGVYFYELVTDKTRITKKMLLLR